MKKVTTLAAMLLALTVSVAQAQDGLNLAWTECITGAGPQDMVFACNTNTGAPFVLSCSVVVPEAMPMFAATNTVVDFHVGDVTLPAWWQTLSGQCRQNAIAISYDVTNNLTSCADLWQGNINIQVSQVFQDVNGGASYARIIGVAAVPAGSEISVPKDDAELWVCRVTIGRAATVGACNTGCSLGACIVLNEMFMQQPGLPAYRITNEATRQWVTWNGGGGTNCPTDTPTLNRTWGAVKGLYR